MARILVVEDEKIVARDIQRRLIRHGHEVPVIAGSGADALAAAEQTRPGLVLMDIALKGPMDGIECAALLRERLQIPVVYLTANTDEETLDRARGSEPFGYLLKPFQEPELLTTIGMALHKAAADARIRSRESWLSTILTSIADAVVTTDCSGLITLVNPVGCRLTGVSEAEALGKPFPDVVRARVNEQCAELASRFRAAIGSQEGAQAPVHCTLVSRDGSLTPVEGTVTAIRDSARSVSGAVLLLRDVTERVRAVDALTASERKYRELFENSIEGIFQSTPEGKFISVNPRLARMLGYDSARDLMAVHGNDTTALYINPDQRQQAIQELSLNGFVSQVEGQALRRDGSRIWVSMNARAVRDAGGNMQRLEGSLVDITEQKEALEALKHREACLRSIMETAPLNIWLKDRNGVYLDLNKNLAAANGFDDIEAMRGKTDFDISPPEHAREIRAADEEVMNGGGRLVFEETLDRDGRKLYTEKYKSPIRDASGAVIGVCGFGRDITEQRRSEEMLRKLSRAVEQSPSTIVITDTSGKIEYVNPRFTDLTGYAVEEAIGQNPRMLNSGKTSRDTYAVLWKTIAAGGEWSGELLNRKKNGELFWEHANICPVRDDKGVITHYVAIKEDITKRKEVEAELAERAEDLLLAKSRAEEQAKRLSIQAFELRKAREEALKASQMKSEFVANMSHEIRTPMNGVLGMTGLLLDTELNDEQKEYAGIIRTSGEALLSIVNDILDFSKIEAGKLELEVIDFNLRTTLEESVDLVAARTREKGLELNYDIADDVPTDLRGDPGRIRQILANLLSNAVKFTERGEIGVDVSRGAGSGDPLTLEMVIRDTGIGISEVERSRLFKPFSQADGSTTRKHGGTGLGLVIAKQLVEMMGGEIGVRSEKGIGSEFWFTVNLTVQPSSAPATEKENLNGIRAIIVDDVGTSRKVLGHLLASWGMRPHATGGGEDALGLIRREAGTADPFRIALVDMQMPGMDGLALARAVASDEKLAGLRLLLMSSGSGGVREALPAGMKFCLTKPVKEAALRACIERALSTGEGTAAVDPGPIAPEDGEDGTVGRARRHLTRVLVAEDNQVNQRVAVRMLEKMACRADVVANGKEAVEAVAHLPYDMVLMDCQMPEMDGFEAAALIRKLPGRASRTLVVAMTASALQGDSERCIASGMDDYLAKPVTQEALGRIMEKWSASLAAGGTSREPRAGVMNGGDDPIDPSKIAELREMAGEDNPLWLDTLVGHFLRDASGRLASLRSACRDRNAKVFDATAHSLKGSCATMGVTPMEVIAGRLEAMGRSGAIDSAVPLIDDLERELARAERQLELVLVERKGAR